MDYLLFYFLHSNKSFNENKMTTTSLKKLIKVSKILRDVCATCFRVIGENNLSEKLDEGFFMYGIKNGFGKDADEIIPKAQEELAQLEKDRLFLLKTLELCQSIVATFPLASNAELTLNKVSGAIRGALKAVKGGKDGSD